MTVQAYTRLTALYEAHAAKGFTVLAFPSNQFRAQEPGTDAEIKAHVQSTYGVKFPLFSKSDVNGDNTNAVYAFLKQAFPGDIDWNFGGNFLIDRDGRVVRRYNFKELDQLETELLPLLEKPASS